MSKKKSRTGADVPRNTPHHKKRAMTCSIISLGCPKNLTDSELMIGKMIEAGFRFYEFAPRVDVMILNTCGFLDDARNEASQVLASLIKEKKQGAIKKIVVTGCAVQWERETLVDAFPEVDFWLGVFDEFRIAELTKELCEQHETRLFVSSEQKAVFDDSRKHRLTLPHVAYLKIADGCSRHCAYCLIPKIRGPYISRPKQLIIDEAKRLADEGVREVIMIAQETNFWGIDQHGKPMLAELIAELNEINGFDWLRLMYTYPLHFSDELIDLFAAENKLLPYIDLPLQHCNDTILQKMNRKANKSETEALLSKLRERVPGLILRTSLITGFPGETDAMFEELLAFAKQWQFERAGVFKYSQEFGTAAATLPEQVDDRTKAERYAKLYHQTEQQTQAWAAKQIGKQFDVLLDQYDCDELGRRIPDLLIGRTYADAPTIDPIVMVTVQPESVRSGIKPGKIVRCEIVMADGVNLIAVPVLIES